MEVPQTYRCAVCGKDHKGAPLSYGFEAPLDYYEVPRWLRWYRCFLTTDTCRIDERRFFLLGNLRIPITGSGETFSWTTWVSLRREDFERSMDLWEVEGRENEPACSGRLASAIPGYPDTLNLKVLVHTQPIGVRPELQLERSEHPLVLEQRNGINWTRVNEIACIAAQRTAG